MDILSSVWRGLRCGCDNIESTEAYNIDKIWGTNCLVIAIYSCRGSKSREVLGNASNYILHYLVQCFDVLTNIAVPAIFTSYDPR